MIYLREYQENDLPSLSKLFYDTVHTVNKKDYTKLELDAWATGKIDSFSWNKSFLEHNTFIAEIDKVIVGFGDMDDNGYLDRLYVHKDYQNIGVASALLKKLECEAISKGITFFTTNASITAKPFFERHGYITIHDNKVIRNSVTLINYTMEKHITR